MALRLFIMRHGETKWSLSGQHTGLTDLPLTEQGEEEARQLGKRIRDVEFSSVFASPLMRASRTCQLAGLGEMAQHSPDLVEWDNGDYEGITTAQILSSRPGWDIFRDGCPAGEMPDQVSERADRFIRSTQSLQGNVALFTHGHFARALAARWIGMPVEYGTHFTLGTAAVSIVSHQHNPPHLPIIELWNWRGQL